MGTIRKFLERLYLKYKIGKAKDMKKIIISIWAENGKGSNQIIFDMYSKSEAEIMSLEKRLKML